MIENLTSSQMLLKAELLTHGCSIQENVIFPNNTNRKSIHLYAHSDESSSRSIPDDILIGGPTSNCIVRIRFNSNSHLKIIQKYEEYFIHDSKKGREQLISFISAPQSSQNLIKGHTLGSICSYLGIDLLGLIPSNYCFYFKNEKQCKFCEIIDTFKEKLEYRKAFKDLEIIENSVINALNIDSHLKFLAVTSGNLKTYDFTAQYFCEIGKALSHHPTFRKLKQVLATLMPPDDFSLIPKIKETGFNKIYFALEVFEKNHFARVCPGKNEYGYERLLEALEFAIEIFGAGNVYTNFVYGIQSLDEDLNPLSYDSVKENEKALQACEKMLEKKIIPAFTLYHYSGYNSIGKIQLDSDQVFNFFCDWGALVHQSALVNENEPVVLFGPRTLSNTLFNDGYCLAKKEVLV